MKRFKYGQNFSAVQSGKFFQLVPLAFIEVAPGETFAGKLTSQLWSDTTSKPILNRTYFDTYSFYVPFRLLWDSWPAFIAEKDAYDDITTYGTDPLTKVTASKFFMEGETQAYVAPDKKCLPWNRRAYNLIWNKFFRLAHENEVSLDQNTQLRVGVRPTTFHESAHAGLDISSTQVQEFAGNIYVDNIRQAFTEDRFKRIREYYGDGYKEYLAALGVNTGWSIADEPETIGKNQRDLVYRHISATAGNGTDEFIGDPAGYFSSKNIHTINKTFCPEHGLIVSVGCVRMDFFNLEGNTPPWLAKATRQEYYSPEQETKTRTSWPGQLWGRDTTDQSVTRPFEEYRKPSNQLGSISGLTADWSRMYYHTIQDTTGTPNSYSKPDPADFDGIFTGTMGGASSAIHYSNFSEVRGVKHSPIKPPQGVRGVS